MTEVIVFKYGEFYKIINCPFFKYVSTDRFDKACKYNTLDPDRQICTAKNINTPYVCVKNSRVYNIFEGGEAIVEVYENEEI